MFKVNEIYQTRGGMFIKIIGNLSESNVTYQYPLMGQKANGEILAFTEYGKYSNENTKMDLVLNED